MGRGFTVLLVVLAAGLTGCPGAGGVDCTAIAAVSVTVTVVDADGNDVPEAEVSYQGPDDAEPRPCEAIAGVHLCGYEVAGVIELYASAPDHPAATAEVEVLADECHVITEEYTFVLDGV